MFTESSPGFFGKVPAVGDFVSRRLSRNFLDPWDQWLQSAMVCSREQLAEAWLDYYLSSPIWRFALSSQVAGPSPCSGILMPSVDQAGRYFPFTLVTSLPDNVNVFRLAGSAQSWYEEAEAVALSVLDDTPPDIESLDQQVIGLGVLANGFSDESDRSITDNAATEHKSWHFSMRSVNGMADILPEMVKRLTELRFGAFSLWWSAGSERIEPAMLLAQGLPPASGYAAMLGGNWQQYGWGGVPMPASGSTS